MKFLAAFLFLGCVSACTLFGLVDERAIASIDVDDPNVVPLTFPDTVSANTSFTVIVGTTIGGCTREDGAESDVSGMVAVVTPYIRREDGDACRSNTVYGRHEATLRFDTPGDGRIIVRAVNHGEPLELEYAVVVN